MHLDFGPCGIDGPTDPVIYEDRFIASKVEVPRKCVRCRFLIHDAIYGFTCRKDEDKWGGCHRGLDWGAWSPQRMYLELPHPKITTKVLVDYAHADDLAKFVLEHRRVNPGLSLAEARDDFARFHELIIQRRDIEANQGKQGGRLNDPSAEDAEL